MRSVNPSVSQTKLQQTTQSSQKQMSTAMVTQSPSSCKIAKPDGYKPTDAKQNQLKTPNLHSTNSLDHTQDPNKSTQTIPKNSTKQPTTSITSKTPVPPTDPKQMESPNEQLDELRKVHHVNWCNPASTDYGGEKP